MASFGDAVLYGIPLFLILIAVFAFISEFSFMSTGSYVIDDGSYNGVCINDKNDSNDAYCKDQYGILGLKQQWVSDGDQQFVKDFLMASVDNDSVNSLCPNGVSEFTMENGTQKITVLCNRLP